MFSLADTIVAIATPLGRSGLGVVRISGPEASRVASALLTQGAPLSARRATFRRLRQESPSGAIADQVVVTSFPGPASYTGEDSIEISAHGSPLVLRGIVHAAIRAGARLAEPGEFTLRAFLNGKLDLIQAEAIADLIDAVTPAQARAAFDQLEGTLTTAIARIEGALFDLTAKLEASLDFPEEGYHFVTRDDAALAIDAMHNDIEQLLASAAHGRLLREGAQVAIVGAPNVGKSSVFNALLNADRAIVTPIAGTTRDLLTERAEIAGVSVALIDTAGVRDTDDAIEKEGVTRARQAQRVADLTLLVLDRSRPRTSEEEAALASSSRRRIVIVNKIDLPAAWSDLTSQPWIVELSALNGQGIDRLRDAIADALEQREETRDVPLVSNVRHVALLEKASEALERAMTTARDSSDTPEEFLLADLQEAAAALQEITGRRTTDDLLRHIFQRFCIGK